jgi:predicted Zn-dependent protease
MSSPDAIARARAMVEKHPASELARFSYAKALFDAGQHTEAAAQLQQCVAKKPDWMVATILLGRSLIALDRKAEAKQTLERALELAIAQNHVGPRGEVEALLDSLG